MTESLTDGPRQYPRVVAEIASELADDLIAELFALGATGVEQRDDHTLEKSSRADRVMVLATFSTTKHARAAVDQIQPRCAASMEQVPEEDWANDWKRSFRAFALTPSIVVCPPWERLLPEPGQHVITLAPGRAFGTGLHPTTALVALAVERHIRRFRGKVVLDVGCGTGILSLVALKLGASRARGIDNDSDAVPVALEVASQNGFDGRFEVDVTDLSRLQGRYPLVVANIEVMTLLGMARDLERVTAPSGLLVLSGILEEKKDAILSAYSRFEVERIAQHEEWVAVELVAPS